MSQVINTLLDEIDRLYPPERINASRRRLAAVWFGHELPDRLPFVFTHLPADAAADEAPVPEGELKAEASLRGQLESIIARAVLTDDYIPSLFPGLRQGLLTTPYGAREIETGGHIWAEPIINDPADVYSLVPPDFTREGVAAEFLEMIRTWRALTHGRIPIQMPDMQGPLDLASNLWGTQDLIMAMMEAPEAVHALLELVTNDYIRYLRLVSEASEGDWVPLHCMPSVWMPRAAGVALSEDLLAVVSPRLYREFGVPYNERIARAWGGTVIHSCGSIEHNLPALAATHGLVGINISITETNLDTVLDRLSSQQVLLAHHALLTCNDLPHLTCEQFIRCAFPAFTTRHWRGIPMPIPLEMDRAQTLEVLPLAHELAVLP
ncbi:MAG: hypothetical protein GXY52_04975 [Chloroflexi bacterium]|nr:hypothetical protein [Chloroflexota bacterium]